MRRLPHALPTRLALTVALLYTIHFAPNVVRETYLAVALAEQFSIRVDRFVGLHPDLFEISGRGAYINNNPGASMIAAVPYALVRPVLELVYRAEPSLVAPKPPATYDDPRPNRTRFMNEMRARGLDVRLGLAAIAIHLGFNVPMAVLATVALFLFLRDKLSNERAALWLALLYAFGTPVFFRSAFLNQNVVLAHCTLVAFLSLVWRTQDRPSTRSWSLASTHARSLPSTRWRSLRAARGGHRLALAGALLGFGLLCDYSAAPLLIVFGGWVVGLAVREQGLAGGVRSSVLFTAGAVIPISVLLSYQYVAFGNPLLPAQAYMPSTDLSVEGWNGMRAPMADLLWRNLLDPRYGLLAFCPMLAAAVLAPRYRNRRGGLDGDELTLIYSASVALYLFSSSISFASLQWNTGVRYLVPAVPLLFIALVPVLMNVRRSIALLLVIPTVAISWAVTMARESVPVSLQRIVTMGPELPWHTVLEKTASAYLPALPREGLPLAILSLAAVVVWLIWTVRGGSHSPSPAR